MVFDPTTFVREVAEVGVREAAQTLRDEPGRSLLAHVKGCVADVLKQAVADQYKELRNLAPKQLLDTLLRLSRADVAWVLERISFDQRNGLVGELTRRELLYGGARLSLDLDDAPEDDLLWLLWYIFQLHKKDAGMQGLLAEKEVPTVMMVDLSGGKNPQPRNSRGEPINLAGPILVKVFDRLTGLPNNEIPASARTNTRLGRAFNVDPDVVARWKKHPEWHELRVDIQPDDKGGVYHTFDLEALLCSARIVTGCKRGPKPKQPPKDST